jgi:tetratricopeptide (TPR) repeat protein
MTMKQLPTLLSRARLGLAAILISLFTTITANRAGAAEEAGDSGDALEAAALAAADQSETKPAVELSPAVVFQLLAAEIAAQRGQLGTASQTLIELAKSTGDSRLARRATELALRERVFARALAAAELWRELAPSSVQARLVLENLYLAASRFDKAGELIGKRLEAAKTAQERAAIWINLRPLLLRGGSPQAVIGLVESLQQNDRDSLGEAQASLALLQVQAGEKQSEQSIASLLKQKLNANTRLELAQAAMQLKRHDLAQSPLEELAQTSKEPALQSQALLLLAQLMRESERAEEGFRLLDQGLRQDPQRVELLYDHAMAAERLNKLDVAEQSLRRLIAVRPRHAHAYNALGYSLADRNIRLEEAQAYIEKALELAPDDPHIIDSMGWVLYRRGDLSGALNYLQKAYQLQADPEIAIHLGEVLWKLDRKDEALKLWRQAKKTEPTNQLLRETLSRLAVTL